MKNAKLLKLTLLLSSMMTMMAGAIVAPSLPQIKNIFIEVDHIELLSRLIITLPALIIAIFSPVIGYIADRIGRKKILLFSLILYSIGGTSGYFLNDIYYLLGSRIVLGIAVAGIMTIALTLVGDYFVGKERNSFMGIQGAFMGIGGVVFISFAGWLADQHWQLPFLIYLFSIPVFVLAIIYLYEPEVVKKQVNKESGKIIYNRGLAMVIYTLGFLGIVFFYMVPVQIPFLLNKLHMSNSQIGYAISLATLSSAMVSMNYRRIKERFSFKTIYRFALLFMGSGFFIISQVSDYYAIMTGLMVGGLGTGLLMPTGNLWIMSIAPEKIRGTLVGRLSMFIFLGMFLSPVITQPLIAHFDVSSAFMMAAFSMWFISFLLLFIKLSEG